MQRIGTFRFEYKYECESPSLNAHSSLLLSVDQEIDITSDHLKQVGKTQSHTQSHTWEQGCTVVRALNFNQFVPGLIARFVISGLSLLVLYSAQRGFSPGTPVFPSL